MDGEPLAGVDLQGDGGAHLGLAPRSRTVVRTSWPRLSSSATHQPPRKPEPPVTSTVFACSVIGGEYPSGERA